MYGAALVAVILLRPRGLLPRRFGPGWLSARLAGRPC